MQNNFFYSTYSKVGRALKMGQFIETNKRRAGVATFTFKKEKLVQILADEKAILDEQDEHDFISGKNKKLSFL
jgi:hypothetical protein